MILKMMPYELKKIFFIIINFSIFFACGSSTNYQTQSELNSIENINLSIFGPGDVFSVEVLGEEEFSIKKVRVSNDGTVLYPYVGIINVNGLEPADLALKIREELIARKLLVDPQVTVFVTERNSKKVTVLGPGVRKPGVFELSPGLTVMRLITLAGGFTNLANEDSTVVTRMVKGKMKRFHVNVDAIQRGRQNDVLLLPGDSVFVPQRAF